MAKMKGQVVEGKEGKLYRFKGGDEKDRGNWEEISTGGKVWGGFKGQWDKYAYGLKDVFTDLQPEEKLAVENANKFKSTLPGGLSSAAFDIAATWPIYGAMFGATAGMAPTARNLTQIGASGAIGAGSGALSNPGSRAEGAVKEGLGAATGTALGVGLKGAFSPGVGSYADDLMKQGARLTPGQSAGGIIRSVEDAVRPINPSIAKRQQEGIADWNRIKVNEQLGGAGLGKVKGTGHQMIADAQDEFGRAYDKAGTKMIAGDATFAQNIDDLQKASAPYLTMDEQARLADLIRVSKSMAGGQKNTQAFRQFEDDLARQADMAGPNMKEALRLLKNHAEGLRSRQGAATPDLDESYAAFSRMKEAAASQGAMDTGIFSPGQLRSRVKAKSGVNTRAKGDALLQRDVAQAESVLGDTIPKVGPGTAEKTFWGTTIPAAGVTSYMTGSPAPIAGALGLFGANKLAYTPQGVKFLTGQYPWQLGMSPEVMAAIAASGGALADR